MVKFNLLESKRTKDQKCENREQHGCNICVIQQSMVGCGLFIYLFIYFIAASGGDRGRVVQREREREHINFFGFRNKYGIY